MNRYQSLLIAELKKCAENNKIIVLYNIDTGSKGNIMPWHILKRLFKNVTEAKLKKTIKSTSN